jgi:DUF971 family protein
MALWRSPVRARYGPRRRTINVIVLFLYARKNAMIPTQIKLSSPDELSIQWDDGHASIISLHTLRENCPCAGCQGETVLLKTYKPEPQQHLPGRYTLTGVQQVGHYALQISWGDGHSTGIYTWAILRNLCECQNCLDRPIDDIPKP